MPYSPPSVMFRYSIHSRDWLKFRGSESSQSTRVRNNKADIQGQDGGDAVFKHHIPLNFHLPLPATKAVVNFLNSRSPSPESRGSSVKMSPEQQTTPKPHLCIKNRLEAFASDSSKNHAISCSLALWFDCRLISISTLEGRWMLSRLQSAIT